MVCENYISSGLGEREREKEKIRQRGDYKKRKVRGRRHYNSH